MAFGRHRMGRLAKAALKWGHDLELAPRATGGRQRLALLDGWKQVELDGIDMQGSRRRRPVVEKKERLEKRRERRHEKRREKRQRREAKRRVLTSWRNAGVLERLLIIDAPAWVQNVVLGLLALLDYYVFAKAAAVALDVEESLANPEFWLGGLYGLLVFTLGMLLARSLKRLSLAYAQRSMAVEVVTEDGKPAPASSANVGAVIVTGALFAVLCLAGVLIRLEAGTSERESILVFQMLVPILVVIVEYLFHDPTDVPEPRRTVVDWYIDRRITRLEKRLDTIEESIRDAKRAIENVYEAEERMLRVELGDRLFDLDGAAPTPT